MEDPSITISLVTFLINIVALAVGQQFGKFKETAIGVFVFDLAMIITLSKTIGI